MDFSNCYSRTTGGSINIMTHIKGHKKKLKLIGGVKKRKVTKEDIERLRRQGVEESAIRKVERDVEKKKGKGRREEKPTVELGGRTRAEQTRID